MQTTNIIDAELYLRMLRAGAAALNAGKADVNKLNVFPVPDGDTGTNMFLTLDSVNSLSSDGKTLSESAEDAARAAMRSARGNSGVILSLFFRGMAKTLSGHETADIPLVLEAFRTGAETARSAVLKPVEGTILTVMRECCAAGRDYPEDDLLKTFEILYAEAQETLKKTPDMLPALKRAKVVDSGGYGFTIVLSGMIRALKGETVEMPEERENGSGEADFSMYSDEEITFSFCTECLANRKPETTQEEIDALRSYLSGMGDSIVMVSDDEIIKIHVHTNEPLTVLGKITELGIPQLIKVENMRQQHNELIVSEEKKEKVPYGIITVANGDGLTDLFKELGAGYVVSGGQSMNPSANEFLKAIKHLNCENAILLPNNSNIVLTAQQAAKMCEDVKVGVVRSVTIPQGIAAMIAFDPSADLDENIENMTDATKAVTTLAITRAVRNADINDVKVLKKQFIGLADNNLVCANDTLEGCLRDLSGYLKNRDAITLYYGKGVKEETAKHLADVVREIAGDGCEPEVICGRQPIYHLIISAE